jgi:Uri superfamily endonuclease
VSDLKGTYALVLELDRPSTITVGKLGTHCFPPGYYLYIGSALGGIQSRVRRHVCGGKRQHWHIDYLRELAAVVEVWYLASPERLECRLCCAAAGMDGAQVPVAGFGSSECGCRSHLLHFAAMPSFERFQRQLDGTGLGPTRAAPECFC